MNSSEVVAHLSESQVFVEGITICIFTCVFV